MPKSKKESSTITIQIPSSFWTQDSAEAGDFVDMFDAAMCEGDEDISQDIQARLDAVSEIALSLDEFQKAALKVLREDAIPDFEELSKVPPASLMHQYAYELTRGPSYNLADIKQTSKAPIHKVQQIRDFLASKGLSDREEQNVLLSVIHQNLLRLHGRLGTLFLSVASICTLAVNKSISYNISLLSYDPVSHIATLKFEQELNRFDHGQKKEHTAGAIFKIDLVAKTIAINAEITLQKDKLAPCAKKFLRKFEGHDPEHFIFGFVSSDPSWRDILLASIDGLEAKEEELSALIFSGECSRQLKISASDLVQEISSLRRIVYNIFCDKGEEDFIKPELATNARYYLDVLHNIADMEIKCLKENTPPTRHEIYQLRDQLQQLSFQSDSLGRKIKNAFHRLVSAFSNFLHGFVSSKTAKKPAAETEEMRTKAFGSLRKCLRRSISALVKCANKKGLCLDTKIVGSESATLIPEAMELQTLTKSGQKVQQAVESETKSFDA